MEQKDYFRFWTTQSILPILILLFALIENKTAEQWQYTGLLLLLAVGVSFAMFYGSKWGEAKDKKKLESKLQVS